VAFDFEGGVLLDLADKGVESGVLLEVGYFAAGVADKMVMVAVAAGEVSVAAPAVRVLVDSLQDAYAAQEVYGTENGGASDAGGVGLDSFTQFGGGERGASAYYFIEHDAAGGCGTESLLLEAFKDVVYF
jgi:hypothetical protein